MPITELGNYQKQTVITKEDLAKRMKESLLKRFKECMRRQFADRIRTHGGLTDLELRNAARTFAMGWAEGLAARGDTIGTHCWALAFGDLTTEYWWPSEEWRFW